MQKGQDHSKRETMFSRRKRTDPHMNSQRLGQHTQDLHRFKPDTIPALNGRTGYKDTPTPNHEVIYKRELLVKRLSVFSNGVSLNISMTPQDKPYTQEWLTNDKINSMVVFVYILFNFALFGHFLSC